MKSRYVIYVIITIICIVAIIAGVYYTVFRPGKNPAQNNTVNEIQNPIQNVSLDPEELVAEFNSLFDNTFDNQGYDVSKIKKLEIQEDGINYQDQDVIFTRYNLIFEDEEKYSINVVLPVFNVQGETAAKFNETTQKIFANKVIEILNGTDKYTICNVEYVAYLNENILSLVLKATLKEGNSPQRLLVQTYNYDIVNDKEVSLNEVLAAKGITKQEANKKIEQVVKEAAKRTAAIASALAQSGQNVYERNIDEAMYVTDNVNFFFMGTDGQIYIVYPYGNNNFTSEIDVIKL